MYYIKGKIVRAEKDYIIIENDNFGYRILTNDTDVFAGDELIYYICDLTIEERIYQIGFLDAIELEVFLILFSITGIGIKTALKILKSIDYRKLVNYAKNDNFNEILKVNMINSENYYAVASKLKKRFLSIKFDDNGVTSKESELCKVLKSLGFASRDYQKVMYIDEEEISLKEKLNKALKVIYDRK